MTKLKWFFMSKYKKLLYQIEVARNNNQILYLPNRVVLDFTKDKEGINYAEVWQQLQEEEITNENTNT